MLSLGFKCNQFYATEYIVSKDKKFKSCTIILSMYTKRKKLQYNEDY